MHRTHGCCLSGSYITVVRRLLQAQASIDLWDRQGDTALTQAAYYGHTGVVDRLLQEKANAELRDRHGETALQMAESQEHGATAKLLRRHMPAKPALIPAPSPFFASICAASAVATARVRVRATAWSSIRDTRDRGRGHRD